MTKKKIKMFYWCGVQLFDAALKEYGGYNHWLAKLFGFRYNYVCINLRWQFRFINHFEREQDYYDGYHNCFQIGFLQISYGT